MINRRLIIIFVAALTLIVLLNGAWYYGYHDQPHGLTENNNGPPSTESKLHNDAGSKGHEHPQPELPPTLDTHEEELLFDHGIEDAASKDVPENSDKFKAPGTSEKGSGETSVTRPGSTGSMDGTSVDWSRFAYVQYVTAAEHVCNSVMVFESLHRLASKADRVLLYPEQWGEVGSSLWKAFDAATTKLLMKAKDEYNVILKPIDLISKKGQERTWEAGFTKLLAFNESHYDRTIMFDNDATVLRHLDHLFLLPPTPLAIPRAYWLFPEPLPEKTIHKYVLSAQLLVVTPNQVVFNAMLDAIKTKGTNDYDMEIINWVLGSEAMVLPHRALNLLSGEFRQEHKPGYKGYNRYLGLTGEVWDAKKVLEEAYYVHFSDYPRPKPWYHPHEDAMPELLPKCYPKIPTVSGYDSRRGRRLRRNDQEMDCSDKETWLWLYSDFKDRRKNICGLDLSRPPYK